MGFNIGSSTGGVSSPSSQQGNSLNVNPTSFGSGGITIGNIEQGGNTNDQTSVAEGGKSD